MLIRRFGELANGNTYLLPGIQVYVDVRLHVMRVDVDAHERTVVTVAEEFVAYAATDPHYVWIKPVA